MNILNQDVPNYERVKDYGFWGGSASLEYYYDNKHYLSTKFTLAAGLIDPVPAPRSDKRIQEILSTWSVELTHNHKRKNGIMGMVLLTERITGAISMTCFLF